MSNLYRVDICMYPCLVFVFAKGLFFGGLFLPTKKAFLAQMHACIQFVSCRYLHVSMSEW